MRLLHPKTIEYIIKADDSLFDGATSTRRQILSHVWSECFKSIGSGKPHPKMFLEYDNLVHYMNFVYDEIKDIVNVSNKTKERLDLMSEEVNTPSTFKEKFDDLYLFSDMASLYFKGVNIFPMRFPETWRKYIPVESLAEIKRQVTKTLNKK